MWGRGSSTPKLHVVLQQAKRFLTGRLGVSFELAHEFQTARVAAEGKRRTTRLT